MVRPGDPPFGAFEDVELAETDSSPLEQASCTGDGALLAHALYASTLRLAVLEIEGDRLRILSMSPAFRDFFAPVGTGDLGIRDLPIQDDFARLWIDSCHEATVLATPLSFHHRDATTDPPRGLDVRVAPLPRGEGEARRLSCQIEERRIPIVSVAGAGGETPDSDLDVDHLLGQAPCPLWSSTADGARDHVNAAWLELTGRELHQELGDGWLEAVHPDDVLAYREAFVNAQHENEPFRHEFRLRRHDGSYRFMLDAARPRWRSDGELLGYVGSLTDITELRRAEARLRRSEAWHRDLIDGTDNLVLQLDGEGIIVFTNPMSRRLLGAEPEECVGFPILDFVDPEDHLPMQRHLDSWRRGEITSAHVELRLRSRGGEVHDMSWLVHTHPERSGTLINCIGQDISARKRAERVRRIQSQVLESMIEGVTLSNPAGFILYTNPALDEMFGYGSGELVGQSFQALGGRPVGLSLPKMELTIREKGVFVGESTHRRKDGTTFHTVSRVKQIEIDGARHWISVIEDVTERKRDEMERQRLDQRIQQAQKLESLGVLAGGIAHDFNNLLMVMLGNASLALQDLDVAQSAYADVEQIEAAAMRAAELTKQMLAYSGKGQFMVEPVDLSAEVSEMGHLLTSSVAKGVELEYQLTRGLPRVECDVSQIRQVVINLTINASEAIGSRSGRVILRTGSKHCSRQLLDETFLADELPEGTYVYLQVLDDGSGMDHSTLTKIFDPFFTTKFTGRGLGLAAVLGIVRGHRGGIKIDSRVGRGSTFTVLLPAAEELEEIEFQRCQSSTGLAGEGTVLLVDDDDSVRRMAARMLERLGFEVLTAESGAEAIDVFRRHQNLICAVLLDMTMPKMDGEETFRHLQAIRPGVPVVLSSGYSEQIAAERFEGSSPAGFLQKPYRQTDLILKMDEVLDLRGAD